MSPLAYEMTWQALERLEAEGIELDEFLIEYVRACCIHAAEVVVAFNEGLGLA